MIRYSVCLAILIIHCVSCKVHKQPSVELAPEEFIFPLDWIGHFEGDLNIYQKGDLSKTIKMELIIDHPNSEGYYPWTIIYDKKDVRSYGLEPINPQVGHYIIDEFNSIKIDAYFNGGRLISRFDVMGSDLVVIYNRTNKGIEIDFHITSSKPIQTTGMEILGQDTIPKVNSYPLLVYQKALLSLKKD